MKTVLLSLAVCFLCIQPAVAQNADAAMQAFNNGYGVRTDDCQRMIVLLNGQKTNLDAQTNPQAYWASVANPAFPCMALTNASDGPVAASVPKAIFKDACSRITDYTYRGGTACSQAQ